MTRAFWIVVGDKTSCGGEVLEGKRSPPIALLPIALHGSRVSCGKHPGVYTVVGGHPKLIIDGIQPASTLYSHSGCPCKATFYATQKWNDQESTAPSHLFLSGRRFD